MKKKKLTPIALGSQYQPGTYYVPPSQLPKPHPATGDGTIAPPPSGNGSLPSGNYGPVHTGGQSGAGSLASGALNAGQLSGALPASQTVNRGQVGASQLGGSRTGGLTKKTPPAKVSTTSGTRRTTPTAGSASRGTRAIGPAKGTVGPGVAPLSRKVTKAGTSGPVGDPLGDAVKRIIAERMAPYSGAAVAATSMQAGLDPELAARQAEAQGYGQKQVAANTQSAAGWTAHNQQLAQQMQAATGHTGGDAQAQLQQTSVGAQGDAAAQGAADATAAAINNDGTNDFLGGLRGYAAANTADYVNQMNRQGAQIQSTTPDVRMQMQAQMQDQALKQATAQAALTGQSFDQAYKQAQLQFGYDRLGQEGAIAKAKIGASQSLTPYQQLQASMHMSDQQTKLAEGIRKELFPTGSSGTVSKKDPKTGVTVTTKIPQQGSGTPLATALQRLRAAGIGGDQAAQLAASWTSSLTGKNQTWAPGHDVSAYKMLIGAGTSPATALQIIQSHYGAKWDPRIALKGGYRGPAASHDGTINF